jgi:inhibitor of KinA|tara:strand:+ start:157 stop:846 length:690 start_codon:yes stop_codon:yes gene_type:complete
MLKKISNIGDCGITCDFGDEVNKNTNKEVIKLFNFIQDSVNKSKIKGILNYTPSYNKLIINFELGQIKSNEIIEFIKSSDYSKINLPENNKIVEIPICYDEEFALDIKRLEQKTKLNFKEIVSKHLETNFFVYMIGFVPGQPFLGDLSESLYHDRLDTPRIRINKGSVGIVEKFCTIYTFESPGGWNIIGRTPFELFNINKTNTSILSPGDTVKFKSISKKEFTLFKNE